MKTESNQRENGSILMMAMITITILTLICATSLYVTSQNANATTQTTSWQQAMCGAEAGVDLAMNALNKGDWTGWYPVSSSSLPGGQPNPTATPFPSGYSVKPGANQYYYYSSSLALEGEAGNSVTTRVTVDNGSISPVSSNLSNGGQAYRIRSAGYVPAPGPARVSANKLDNDLRKISLRYDRLGSGSVTQPQAVRRIELVAKPVLNNNNWPRGITLANWISMSGSATVYSDIGLADSASSDLRGMYVYGGIQYSGPVIKGTTNVQGNIESPFNPGFVATVDPTVSGWGSKNNLQQYTSSEQVNLPVYAVGNYTNYTGGGGLPKNSLNQTVSTFTASGPSANPTLIKVSGDFTVSGGGLFNLVANASGATKYVIIWVTGKLTLSGGSSINQNSNVAVTWIVDKDVTISGGSYNNQSSTANNFEIIGVGNNKVTISSSSDFAGTVNAPGAQVTISGSGNFTGAVLADNLTLSGSATFSFDTSLRGTNGVANYSYASWFEDNSDPARGITY